MKFNTYEKKCFYCNNKFYTDKQDRIFCSQLCFEIAKEKYARIIRNYKESAEERFLGMTLSYMRILYLFSQNCYYCDSEPSTQYANLVYNGIDRVDNSLGYSKENTVSCCPTCNRMKGTLSRDDFIIQCKKIDYYFSGFNKALNPEIVIIDTLDSSNSRRTDYGDSSKNNCYYVYYKNAEYRNISFKLSKDEFFNIGTSSCIYCGNKHTSIYGFDSSYGKLLFTGIDRIDSSKGYIGENCVPCCKICNYMKSNINFIDFISKVTKISVSFDSKTIKYFFR